MWEEPSVKRTVDPAIPVVARGMDADVADEDEDAAEVVTEGLEFPEEGGFEVEVDVEEDFLLFFGGQNHRTK